MVFLSSIYVLNPLQARFSNTGQFTKTIKVSMTKIDLMLKVGIVPNIVWSSLIRKFPFIANSFLTSSNGQGKVGIE